jgi:hypothetical protein
MASLSPAAWLLFALAIIAVVGFGVLLRANAKVTASLAFTAEYREQLNALVTQEDAGIYEWLTLTANRMQSQMGNQGVLTFRPPFANYVVHNYPVVLMLSLSFARACQIVCSRATYSTSTTRCLTMRSFDIRAHW